MRKGSFMLMVLLSWSGCLFAQDTVAIKSEPHYDFMDEQLNEISNAPALSSFFEKLYQLKKTKKGTVSIVHIGDSHIQADLLTHQVRQLLQKEFGNAGRGFIFPGRIAKTNEPQNIYKSSDATWEAKRIVFADQPLAIGLGASTVRTLQPDIRFTIRTMDSPGLDYRFNRVSLFYKKDSASFNLILKDSANHSLAYAGPYTEEKYPNFSSVLLPYPVHQIEFQTAQPTAIQKQFVLFGVSLSTSKPGIFYHSIGGNGAKFKNYLDAKFFFEQTQALIPDLFIVSLGTNEAIDYPNIDKQFTGYVENFVKRLKQSNPESLIIITIPADFYRKKTRRNPGVESIRTILMEFANKNNLPVWDLYSAAGGKHSADQWKKNKLLQGDGIHATRAGYEVQGELLYHALIKSYNEYVRYRHP